MQVTPAPESPLWWLAKLEPRLHTQRIAALYFESYYDGDQPLPLTLATEDYRQEFRAMLGAVRDNWMPMVIGAKAERLLPLGYRYGKNAAADDDAAAIWQRNNLDADIPVAIDTALTTGRCPVMVWAGPDGRAQVTIEHPAQVVLAYATGSRRHIVAALKAWSDEWTGATFANVYLPDGIYKYARSHPDRPYAEREETTPNPLGRVPFAELRHRQRLRDGLCRSALMEVTSTQDQINKTWVDAFIAAEFAAFRQRWATGVEIPKDPVTKKPVSTFRASVNRVWAVAAKDAKFGDFSATDLDGYGKLTDRLVMSLASRTATPPHYLAHGQVLPNAESVKAAETGLISAVRRIMTAFDDDLETVIRLAFAVEGDQAKANADTWETIWRDPETRSEAELVDALLKKRSLGVPLAQLWEDAGYTQAQIGRFRGLLIDEARARADGQDPSTAAQWADVIRTKAETFKVLIDSGADVTAALIAAGLNTEIPDAA